MAHIDRMKIRLVLIAVVLVYAMVRYPAARWFVLISIAIGIVAAVILHFWNKRPVKLEEDEVRLHLLDEEPPPSSRDSHHQP